MQDLSGFDAVLKDVHRKKGKRMPLQDHYKSRPKADSVFHAPEVKTGMKPGRKSKADVKDSMRKVMRGRGGKR